MVLGEKNLIEQALVPFSPHPSQNMLGKPDSKGWVHSKPLYPSLYIIIIVIIGIYVSPGTTTAPEAALTHQSLAFTQPGTG